MLEHGAVCVFVCVLVCVQMCGCTVVFELFQFKCLFKRPTNDEAYKFHFPCNRGERLT